MDIITILSLIISAWLWWLAWFYAHKQSLDKKANAFREQMRHAEELKEEIISQARSQADLIIKKWEEKITRIEETTTRAIQQTQERLEKTEERLLEREEKLEQKREELDKIKKEALQDKEQIQEIVQAQTEKLSTIARLSQEEAKEELMNNITIENEQEIKEFVEKYRTIKKEEADNEAMQIIARVMPRLATDSVNQFTSELIDIPDEGYKGKLIGREGRNISFFEKVTGVELIIDDTPGVVRISCYEHEKRFIWSTTLKRLIKDGRINPYYIEKIYNDVLEEFDDIILEKWKEALHILNIPMMNPDIVHYVGRFHLRYSYGQSLRHHSIEVAKIAEALASEMGEDPLLAKKAWLLHDIGKVIAENGESHTVVGADTLRKFWMHEAIINAAASHHYEVDMTHTISWIVTAADGISASRPGARFNTKDLFIEKMRELEKLIMDINGIHKVHIMQAWREIMVYVDPKTIPDKDLSDTFKAIGTKIEAQLDYPGVIRMVIYRENKLVEYLR